MARAGFYEREMSQTQSPAFINAKGTGDDDKNNNNNNNNNNNGDVGGFVRVKLNYLLSLFNCANCCNKLPRIPDPI